MFKNINQVTETNFEPLGSAFNKMSTEQFEDDLNIKVNLEKLYGEDALEYLDEDELENIKDGYSINFALKSDPQNSKAELNTTMKYLEKKSELKTLVTEDEFGIQLDELNEKYLIVKNEKLKELFKKFGVSEELLEDIPDKIITDVNYVEKAEQVKALEEKYINRFFAQISEDKYKIEKKVSINYNGQDYIGNKYTLSLTDREASQILLTTVKELLDDPELLNLVSEDEKENFEDQISELKEKISEYEEDEDFEDKIMDLSVYNISDNFTVFEYKYNEGSIILYAQSNESNSTIEVIIHSPDEDEDMIIKINNQYADNSGELTYSLTLESEETKIILKSTNDGDTITTKVNIENEELEEISKALTITNTIKFNDVKFNEIDDENSIVLNDLSEEEIETLMSEIQENIIKCTDEDSNSFVGAILTSFFGSGLSPYSSYSDDSSDLFDNDDIINNDDSNVLDDRSNIEEERTKIEDEVEEVITSLLDEYHDEKMTNDEADPANYLTEEKIISGCTYAKASIVDGNTIKSEKGDNVYFTKIYINGDDWTLSSVETTYSESGEME